MINNESFTEAVKCMRQRTTRLEREGDYWTQEEGETLARLFDDGVGISKMAAQFQRSEPAVMQQIEKLDLYQRKENLRRRRCFVKSPKCLCEDCEYPASACPLRNGPGIEQGVV